MRVACVLFLIACGSKKSNDSKTASADTCTDADGDGYGTGALCNCLSGCSDCDDNDGSVYRLVTVYTDSDHDTFGVGEGSAKCIGARPPVGLATQAGDCNDNSAGCTSDCTDNDGDGVPACAGDCDDNNAYCIKTCLDADHDRHCADMDCNDNSPLHWSDCTTCQDTDNDGRGPGCDAGTSDCAPDDPNVWVSCGHCADNDHDGFWAGCDAYATVKGEDCDDSDPVCVFNCADADNDGVRACDGDCDDGGGTQAACIVNALGANANSTDNGGAGGVITLSAASARFLGSSDALPASFVTHGAVPLAGLQITQDQTMTAAQAATPVAGLFIEKGVTLTLQGAGPFTFTVNDHVMVAGSIVSDQPGGVSLTFVPAANGVGDATLSGVVDLHGVAAASGHAGGTLSVGTSGSAFAHAFVYGSIALRSGDATNDTGAPGGSLSVYAGDIYLAANVDAHSGSGEQAGGSVTLTANNALTIREGGIIASGGASAATPGAGGQLSVVTSGNTTSTSGLLVTLRGGTGTTTHAGGVGGVCKFAVDAAGVGGVSLSTPTITASGGDSASTLGGNGGTVTLSAGTNSGTLADAITIVGGIDVRSGIDAGNGGTVVIAADNASSTIDIEEPVLASGVDGGGTIEVGAFDGVTLPNHSAPPPTRSVGVTIDSNFSADGGNGVVDFNAASITYLSGTISAVGAGGECITRAATVVSGPIGGHVNDAVGNGGNLEIVP